MVVRPLTELIAALGPMASTVAVVIELVGTAVAYGEGVVEVL